VRDDRQLVVRIGVRVAVPGEVLAAAHQPGAAQPAPERHRVGAHRGGVAAEGAVADDRVGGVCVYVEHGREVPADAQRRHLFAQRPPHGRRPRRIAARTHRLHRWPLGRRGAHPLHQPALLIDRHQQRRGCGRRRPQRRHQRRHLPGGRDIRAKQDDAADLAGGDAGEQIGRGHGSFEPDGQQLPDVARQRRHRAPLPGNPTCPFGVGEHIRDLNPRLMLLRFPFPPLLI
jgi:hypothetical protein